MCTHIAKRKEDPINVKTDPRFRPVMAMLKLKTAESQAAGRGIACDAKKALEPRHLRQALESGSIGRHAPKPLITAAHLVAVLGFGCRPGNECHMMENSDLEYGPRRRDGLPEWMKLNERITKTRTGNLGGAREGPQIIHPDDEFPETCSVRTLIEYQRKKKPEQLSPTAPFFLNTLPAAVANPDQYLYWFVGTGQDGSGIMGIHTLERLLTDALEEAGIDCKGCSYTANSLRKAMMQSATDCGVPDLHISRYAGHKSLSSKSKYVNSAGTAHRTTGMVIHRNLYHQVNRGYNTELRKVQKAEGQRVSGDEGSRSRSEDGGQRSRRRSSFKSDRSSSPMSRVSSSRKPRSSSRGRQGKKNYREGRRSRSRSRSSITNRSSSNRRHGNKSRRVERSRSCRRRQSSSSDTPSVQSTSARRHRNDGSRRSRDGSSRSLKHSRGAVAKKRSYRERDQEKRGGKSRSVRRERSMSGRREKIRSARRERIRSGRRERSSSFKRQRSDQFRNRSARKRWSSSAGRYESSKRHRTISDGGKSHGRKRSSGVTSGWKVQKERSPSLCSTTSTTDDSSSDGSVFFSQSQIVEEKSKDGFRKVKMTLKQKSKKNSLPTFQNFQHHESRKGQFDDQRYNLEPYTSCPPPSTSYLPPSTSGLSPAISLPPSTSIPPPSTSDMRELGPGIPVLDRINENTPGQVLKVRLDFEIKKIYHFCLDVRVPR